MVEINLNLGRKIPESTSERLGAEYKGWRDFRKESRDSFFIIPTELTKYLPVIDTRAINLYLYYCFRANNETGLSWPSVDRAAEDLKVSARSINNWNAELEQLGLILRINEKKSSKTTYLLPISDYYYIEKNLMPEEYMEKSDYEIDGFLKYVFHFNQWQKKDPKSNSYNEPFNTIALVYERSYKKHNLNDVTNFIVTKTILFENIKDNLKTVKVDTKATDFTEDVYKFDSQISRNDFSVPVKSLAIDTKINLQKENSKSLVELINKLTDSFNDLDNLPSVHLEES